MKIPAINMTNQNQQQKQSFNGKFIYDELNLLPRQLKEVETIAKNFNITKKPYDISVFSDPRDSHLFFVAEDSTKTKRCSVAVGASKQRPKDLDESVANLIHSYEKKYVEPNTLRGKIKKLWDNINPFSN